MARTASPEAALVGLTEAAQRLGISRTAAHLHAKNGTFPVSLRRVGKLWKVNRAELDAFIDGPGGDDE